MNGLLMWLTMLCIWRVDKVRQGNSSHRCNGPLWLCLVFFISSCWAAAVKLWLAQAKPPLPSWIPRYSSFQLLRCGFGLLLKASTSQVCVPQSSGSTQNLMAGLLVQGGGRVCSNLVAFSIQEFTCGWVVWAAQEGNHCFLTICLYAFGGLLDTSWGSKLSLMLILLNQVAQNNWGSCFHINQAPSQRPSVMIELLEEWKSCNNMS